MNANVDVFYSSPNEISPSELGEDLAELLGELRSRLEHLGKRTLLPARVSGTTRWYALAPSRRDGRLMRDEVQGWMGRPLTTGLVAVSPHSVDLVDQAALNLVPDGSVLRLDVAPGWQNQVRQNVSLLNDVWTLEPERRSDQLRPVGRILRQFYESIVGDDSSRAEAALDELRGRALLSATNLRFLRVELLSALGTAEQLRDDPMLRHISLLARPPAVTENIAEAAVALLVAPKLHAAETSDWRSAAEQLDIVWPALVTYNHQVTTVSTARCFALGQMLVGEPKAEEIRQLSSRYPGDPVIDSVLAAMPSSAAPTVSTGPVDLYLDSRFEEALTLAESSVPDRSTAYIALAAAVSLQDSASAARALVVVDAMGETARAELLGGIVERTFVERLRALTAADRLPRDWLDWLRGDWPDRPDLLSEWSRRWSRNAEDLSLASSAIAEEFIDALTDTRRARVRNGIPVFVEWLTTDGVPPAGVSLAATIFDIMLSSEPGRTERQAALAVLDGVLEAGCTLAEYNEVLAAVARELDVIGPRDSQWLAQVVDILLMSTCPDQPQRSALLARAASMATSWADFLDRTDAILLGLLFRGAGIEFAILNEEVSPKQSARKLRSVGVYSLMESAIRAVTPWIESRWPGVKVRASSDSVNSKSLVSLVQGVDVMLVQTSHAKHAATGAISAAATDPSRVVLVSGRGASSLMRALLDWVDAG